MKQAVNSALNFLLDIIFPIKCLGCGLEGKWLCSQCLGQIKLRERQACPKCFKENSQGVFCEKCQVASKMSGIVVAATYEDKLLQKAVHHLKYKYVRGLAKPLAEVLEKGFNQWQEEYNGNLSEIILLPVPLHKKRQRARGFNQTFLLARSLSNKLQVEVADKVLVRVKNTSSQTKHNLLTRRKNIKNAFVLERQTDLKGKIVFIVDDVCTTSATLEECAKEVAKARPQEIWGMVLARGQ